MASDIYDRVSPEALAGMLVSGASLFVGSVTKIDGREVNIRHRYGLECLASHQTL